MTPVVQWSTVRLVQTLILANSWVTKQVDYTDAFAQAELKEEVYIDSPRGFERKDGKDVLRLNNSIYGLKQACLPNFSFLVKSGRFIVLIFKILPRR